MAARKPSTPSVFARFSQTSRASMRAIAARHRRWSARGAAAVVVAALCLQCCGAPSSSSRDSQKELLRTAIGRHVRSLAYPDGSGMGIFFAIGIPLDSAPPLDGSISLSFYFEANYQLRPLINNSGQVNATEEAYFSHASPLIDRRLLYDSIENHFESYGFRGRPCLQRTICESAKFPFGRSGLLGDLIRIIFTPSSSLNHGALEAEIERAEHLEDCRRLEDDCPLSLLDLISGY